MKILSTLLKADAGTATVNGFDVATQAAEVRGVDQPHRPVRGRRRDPHRPGEPRLIARLRHLAGPGPDRRRAARPLLAHRRRRTAGGDLLRRHAPPARHRDEPDRRPAGASSSTSRPPASTRRPASRCGSPSGSSPHTARRCCSPRSTSTRPSTSPTGSRSCTRAGSSSTAPSPSSRRCCPPAEVEYVEKQPTLEDIFLAIVGNRPTRQAAPQDTRTTMNKHFFGDTTALLGRSLRHILPQPGHDHHHRDHADRDAAAVRLRVRRRDRHRRRASTSTTCCPGILLITVASGIAYTAYRLFLDIQRDLRAVPVDADRPLGGAVGARADLGGREPGLARRWSSLVAAGHGLPLRGRRRSPGSRSLGILRALHAGADLAGRDPRPDREVARRRERVLLPADLPAVRQLGVRAHRRHARPGAVRSPSTSPSPRSWTRSATCRRSSRSATTCGPPSPGASGSLVVAYVLAMRVYHRKIA